METVCYFSGDLQSAFRRGQETCAERVSVQGAKKEKPLMNADAR